MTIPFVDLFQKVKARLRPAPAVAAPTTPRAPVEKPSSEKLSRTFMPNATRTVAPLDPFQLAAGGPTVRLGAGATRVSTAATRKPGLPPMVALALEPKVERTISLQLVDLMGAIPGGYLKPADALDTSRRILLKAAEVEKGMASGKPTVALSELHEQMPEIFLQSVRATDLTQVPLPLDKVIEQFATARVRDDQEHAHTVPQVETPILQATREDSERFGIPMAALQTSSLPAVKVETASAKSFADAEPESAVREKAPLPSARSTINLSAPVGPAPEAPAVAAPPPLAPPARIPFNLPPNGTGAPATERVPASSGPSVPTRSRRTKDPFKVLPPSDDLRPKLTLVPGHGGIEEEEPNDFARQPRAKEAKKDEVKISLPLPALLQNIPAFQLSGSPSEVPADARIELSFALIQPQLATGRVAIPPKVFQAAMPKEFREMLIIDTSETPVMLPLQEVLKNLPGAALQMRADQEEAEKGIAFETPFSIKAKEDAARFKVDEAPIAKPVVPAEIPADRIDKDKIAKETSAASTPAVEEKLDAKEVISRASALEGVQGCSVTFADGLMLAGNLPSDAAVEGLCAMAPSLLQRIEQHMLNTKLGALTAMTLHGQKSAVTFFMQGNICLTALHDCTQLGGETQAKLADMAHKLSRTYAQPVT